MIKIIKTAVLKKRTASLITILAGCVALAGWFLDDSRLKSLFTAFGGMKFNTALCFIFSGIVLYLLQEAPAISRLRKNIAWFFTFLILLIAILSMAYYLFGWGSGINNLWWKVGTANGRAPGKMSLIVSFNFIMLGIVFLLLGNKKFSFLIQVLLIAIIPSSFVVILNHLFGASFLTSIPFRAPTSMVTALVFIVLVTGVFVSPALAYLQFSFVKKVAVFFVLILLVRSTVFFAINRNNQLATDKDKWLGHNHDVILLAEKVNALAGQIENNTRAYIITGDDSFRISLDKTTDTIKNILGRLRLLTNENALQQSRLASLESNLDSFIASQEKLVTVRKNEGFDAARKVVTDAGDASLLNSVYTHITIIEQEENQVLTDHKTRNELIVKNSARIFTLFQVLAGLLMIGAFKMVYDHVRLRNNAEEALKKSLKETSDYQYALNESSIVAITDQKGIIKQVNDNFCKISKYTREELIGRDHNMVNSKFHSKKFIRDLWVTIANGKVWRGELRNKAKDESYYWVDTTIVPLLNESGKPYQYLAIRSDITQRKELEAEIMQMNRDLQQRVEEKTKEISRKERQYRFLLQNMREGIQLISYDWKYLFVNDSAVQHSKLTREELIGHTMMEKYPGIEETNLFQVMKRCMKHRCPEVLENEFMFPDGARQWLELSIQPVPEGLFILSMDIGERKKVEQQLQESEKFLNDSQQVSKIGSYVLDFEKGCWKASRELDNIFGLEPCREHTVEAWLSIIHPDDRRMMQSYFENEVVGKKQRFDKEYRVINARTKKERCVHGIGDLEFDGDGIIIKMMGTIQDITEKKQLEMKLAGQKLKEQKLINEITIQTQEKERKEMGRELHDNVNQILASVKMYLGMLTTGDHSARHDLLEKSYDYVDEAMKEIRKLSHSLVAPSLGDLGLKEALEMLARDTNLLNGVKVELDIDEKYNERSIDKTRELMLYRVVQEQLNNITKYAKAKQAFITLKKENKVLFLTIADNGIGFDTGKKSGGIGLSNMKSRIEFYSGTLNVISAPSMGCKLEISIPSES
ncbi:MAG TPA: PAS domain S-box protein [Chitinophagaceae bacterium]|nr:PAS domain S-box protein [Chitinophagaceae bacterium]